MVKQIILKCYGTCMLIFILFLDGINGQNGMFKAELFLDKDDVPGDFHSGPPEFQLKPGPEAYFPEIPSDSVSDSEKKEILRGNYPRGGGGIDVPEYPGNDDDNKGNSKSEGVSGRSDVGDLQGRFLGFEKFLKAPKAPAILDPITHVIPNIFNGVTDTVEGATSIIGSILGGVSGNVGVGAGFGVGGLIHGGVSVGVNASVGVGAGVTIPGVGELAAKLMQCARQMVLCALGDVFNVQCYLHCIFSSHPLGTEIMGSVNSLMTCMCNPLGTIFDEGVALFAQKVKEIKILPHFLATLNIGLTKLKFFARHAAKAIPTLIIKFLNLPGLQDLKLTINALVTAVKIATKGISSTLIGNPVQNQGCRRINSIDPVQQLVGAVYKGARFVDIVLQGFWTLKKLELLFVVKALKIVTSTINFALSLLTGASCNILHFALTGEASQCPGQELEFQIIKNTSIIPPDPGTPVVCGSIPFIPRSAVDDLFPPIYEIPDINAPDDVDLGEATSQAKQKGRALDGGDGNDTEASGNDLDFAWVDKLLKTKNLDYDDK